MLDNLGFGEFFTLALLALLFFGPEQLPRIGARVGRWVRSLTGYSRAFLTEWREEALAIHDAVQEVKGIRAEINAARAEIASTMNTARSELGEAVDGAKLDVQGQIRDGTRVPIGAGGEAGGTPVARASAGTGSGAARSGKAGAGGTQPGEGAAIDKTQQILDGLAVGGSGASSARVGAGTAAGARLPETQTAPRAQLGIATPRQERARLAMTGAGSVSRQDLARLRGDVSDLSAHVSALRGELARIRALVGGTPVTGTVIAEEVTGTAQETGGAS